MNQPALHKNFWGRQTYRSIIPNDLMIVIGGAPCVGKTKLTRRLGKTLRLPILETDVFQSDFKKTLKPEQAPALFVRNGLTAHDYYQRYATGAQVADIELRQATLTAQALLAAIQNNQITAPVIIEGLAILPNFIQQLQGLGLRVIPLFLIEPQPAVLAQAIKRRGLWSKAWRYPAAFKPLEIAGSLEFQNRLLPEIHKLNVPIIENDAYQTTYERVLKHILSRLL